MTRRAALLLLPLLALLAPPARAGTTCTGSDVSLSFAPYLMVDNAPSDAQATLTVTCTRLNVPPDNSPARVVLSVGLGASQGSNSIQNRRMFQAGAPDLLNYNVYLDPARISVWGNTDGVDTVTQTINVQNKGSASASFTFYGRLFARQNVRPGAYGDSLLITINY